MMAEAQETDIMVIDGIEPNTIVEKLAGIKINGDTAPASGAPPPARKRVVIVGLGMVGIAFAEKLLKYDAARNEYAVTIIGEEPHLAYNRVGLTSFFDHRVIEKLYLNPQAWYDGLPTDALSYHLNAAVTSIDTAGKSVATATGARVHYDTLVLATGSNALVPRHTPGHDAHGVFVYRSVDDVQRLIAFAGARNGSTGVVVGGGLLGLEAAKALMDLKEFGQVKLIERNRWPLSRQLDGDAGGMLLEQITALGLDVMLSKRVAKILTTEENYVRGLVFEDGEEIECSCVCFAIGVRARDDIAKASGIECAERGGGVIVGSDLKTSAPDVYAVGECASWNNETYGLIAPGIEMADVLAFNLTQAKDHSYRSFAKPDLSTKLKLLGVEVASFGDYFSDRDGPKYLPIKKRGAKKDGDKKKNDPSSVKALVYKDPFNQIYKKYIFTLDGKYLLGGMMVGDTTDYIKLLPMVKNQKELEIPPGELIVGASKGGDDAADDLPDDAQICSCHNITKGQLCEVVKNKTCSSIGEVKSCTKAGTGCAGCMPLVQSIFNSTMKSMGAEITNHLCPHFAMSRADLFNVVMVKKLESFESIMKTCGVDGGSLGCEVCKPAVASIISSLFNKHISDAGRRELQDTNDRFLGNIQRNGTFSVIPRVAGGEITAEKLIVIGTVAKKYNLYCKITGGQRIDMFGAKKQDLLAIWEELVAGGMESGHAYAKSLRTIKSCVGTTWCRFGIGDSVGMAVRLEERYKSIRSPHKLKGAVSGCVRECAEAQNKDFGLIATDKGYNIFVGGNGGAKPRHSELLAGDVPPDDVVPILDRYLAFYIRTADRLQRTARWIEELPGGIKYLRDVILNDKLGIAEDLELQMQDLISSYFCEWTEAINDPERRKVFQQFANTKDNIDNVIEPMIERGQERPSYWPKDSVKEDFKGTKWTNLAWQPMVEANQFQDIPAGDSKAIKRGDTQLAIFKVRGKYYCTQQMCPHKRAFVLSDGLIGEDFKTNKLWVSCPLHKRNYELGGEQAGRCANDDEVNIATFPIEERDDGWIYVKLPSVEELDSVLGTAKWVVKQTEGTDPFEKMDAKLKAMKGRKGQQLSQSERVAAVEGSVASTKSGSNGIDW